MALFGRNGRVSLDQPREHAAERLDAERQRSDVQQKHVLHIALEDTGLNRRADCDDFIRIDTLMRFLAKQTPHNLLYLGHTSHAADQHHLIDLAGAEPCILQSLAARFDGFLDQIVNKRFELRPCKLQR